MDIFKKPVYEPVRKIKGGKEDKHQNARLESSVTSVSLSTSQQSLSGYDYASSLYKSVLDDSISSNRSKVLHDASGLHSDIKKFGQTVWVDLLNTTKEWQIEGYVEKYKEMKTRAAMSKGNLNKKMVTLERWYVVINELGLCLKGYVENKNGVITTKPIVKRMDSHTVASKESLYKLKKFIIEDDASSIPHYIINKFACGFPENWKLLKRKWIMFSNEGKPQDFQWEGNENPASLDNSFMYENPTGHSSQQSSCEGFTTETQDSNFAFSSLVAKNKSTERAIRLDSCNVPVVEHCTVNIENCLHSEEERINHVAKRNDPHCSKSANTTVENFMAPKRSFEIVHDDSENSDNERTGILHKQTNFQDGKSQVNQRGNKKKQSGVTRRSDTTQALVNNEILLEKWLPVLKENELCFRGVRSFGNAKKNKYTTAPVKSRVKSDIVALVDGNICKLIGHLYDEHKSSSIPHYIINKFACGFPKNWKLLKKKWIMFLKKGKPQDFNWEGNEKPASLDNSSTYKNPTGHSSQQSSREIFTTETQGRNFAFSPLVTKNKSTERANTLDSCNVPVVKHCTINTENCLHSEEERINPVAARNDPQCSKSTTTTVENVMVVDGSENKDSERAGIHNKQTDFQDGKGKVNQLGNKKKKSGVKRRSDTKQALVNNEILLEKWLPVLKEKELCFRGVRSSGSAKTNNYTTAPVKSRVKSDIVNLVDGNTCKLIGHLYDEHECLPTEIATKFQSGMPANWRIALAEWIFVYSKSTEGTVPSATRTTSSDTNNQQQGNLKTSSRGRILLKPVKHWLGETPSSIIINMVDHSEEKQMEVLNSKHSRHLPEHEVLSSTSDKEKCGMLTKPSALPQKNVKNAVNSKRKKELVDRNVKKSKKEQQLSRPDSDKVVNSEPISGNSCPDSQFENPTYFANSERRVLRSRNKQIVVQKESSNATVDENKSDGISKNAVSRSNRSRKKINGGILKENAKIPVLDRDHKDSTNVGKSKRTTKETNKKDECRRLKPIDIGVEFTDFCGKPPRTLKQRKKLDKVVKTLSQNNKKYVDLYADTAEEGDNCRTAWNDFVAVKDVANFNIGEETPRSKILNGSFFRTPDTSPSTSIFQLTPCNSDEVLKYVHQQKTKTDKPGKKTGTKKPKLPFMPTSSGNHAVDDVYAALLKGEPIPKYIITKEMRIDSDDSDSFSELSY